MTEGEAAHAELAAHQPAHGVPQPGKDDLAAIGGDGADLGVQGQHAARAVAFLHELGMAQRGQQWRIAEHLVQRVAQRGRGGHHHAHGVQHLGADFLAQVQAERLVAGQCLGAVGDGDDIAGADHRILVQHQLHRHAGVLEQLVHLQFLQQQHGGKDDVGGGEGFAHADCPVKCDEVWSMAPPPQCQEASAIGNWRHGVGAGHGGARVAASAGRAG